MAGSDAGYQPVLWTTARARGRFGRLEAMDRGAWLFVVVASIVGLHLAVIAATVAAPAAPSRS